MKKLFLRLIGGGALVVVLILVGLWYYISPVLTSTLGGRTPLPNGYLYGNFGTSDFIESRDGKTGDSFAEVEQVDVLGKYVVGQVRPKGIASTGPGAQPTDRYFILDTKQDIYIGDLEKDEWEAKLKELRIYRRVKLHPKTDQWYRNRHWTLW